VKKCNNKQCIKPCRRKDKESTYNMSDPVIIHGIETGCFNYVKERVK